MMFSLRSFFQNFVIKSKGYLAVFFTMVFGQRVKEWKILLGFLMLLSLPVSIFLFIFLNQADVVLGNNISNYDSFIVAGIVLAVLLFLFLLFFFNFFGLYVSIFAGFFTSLVFFALTNWGSINFDFFAFVLLIFFVSFGVIWQLFFLLSFQNSIWIKSSLFQVWSLVWQKQWFILKCYLLLFLVSWGFFLFGDLGNTFFDWVSASTIERHFFASLGRLLLLFIFLSFAAHFLLFVVVTFVLFFVFDVSLRKVLLWADTLLITFFTKIKKIFQSLFTFLSNKFSKKNTKKYQQNFFVVLKSNRNNLHNFLLYSPFLILISVIVFLAVSFSTSFLFWQKSYFYFWEKSTLTVDPLINSYDNESFWNYLLWEGQTLKLSEELSALDFSNFRAAPIVNDEGKWIYSIEFFHEPSFEVKKILWANDFKEVSVFEKYFATIKFDAYWFLLSWLTMLFLAILAFAFFFGLEYSISFLFFHPLRLFLLLFLFTFFNLGIDGSLLKVVFIFTFLDCSFAFLLYKNSYSRSYRGQNYFSPVQIASVFQYSLLFLFIFLLFAAWTLIYLLLGYNFLFFVPLFLVSFLIFAASFWTDWLILQKLTHYKFLFWKWFRKRLFNTPFLEQTETFAVGLND